MLELCAYKTDQTVDMPITPAAARRDWMDATRNRFANRCLPLVIANQCGWFIGNPHPFVARWNGGQELDDLQILFDGSPSAPRAVSHFGFGILTFRLPYLFRTPPGVNLWVKGPSNWIRDGIQALEGIVETDWATATFTMNWRMTRSGHDVRFERGEPICMVLPCPRGYAESFQPVERPLSINPELEQEHKAFRTSRAQFIENLSGTTTSYHSWQRHYHQGGTVTGKEFADHQTSLDIKPFTRE